MKMLRLRLNRLVIDNFKLIRPSSTDAKVLESFEEAIDLETNLQREEEIERKRNKSRLRDNHYKMLHGQMPLEAPHEWYHTRVRYHRKMYALYGASSNIDPRICWMSKEEFASRLEYNSLAEDRTIPQMVAEVREKRRKEREEMWQRDEKVARNVSNIDKWRKDLEDRLAKKTMEADEAKAKKEKLVEEVRRHFGFKVDPKDERFKEMLEKKEKEQKKADKMARKSAKDAKMLELLKQQASQSSENQEEKGQDKESNSKSENVS